jgi:hypothetical protein
MYMPTYVGIKEVTKYVFFNHGYVFTQKKNYYNSYNKKKSCKKTCGVWLDDFCALPVTGL